MLRSTLIAIGLALASTPLHAQFCAGPLDLGGTVAHDVSADGSVVVGWFRPASLGRACLWTAEGGRQGLGTLGGQDSQAFGVNADGSVIVGGARNTIGQWRPFRWTAANGMQDIGPPGGNGVALDVSADGLTVVGESNGRAFRWTAAGGVQQLGTLPGLNFSRAFAISADGNVIVGSSDVDFQGMGQRPFRWTAAGGMQELGPSPTYGVAFDVSADGSVVVGVSVNLPCVWTHSGNMQTISVGGNAVGVSADGSVVLIEQGNEAYRWTEAGGAQPLHAQLGATFSTMGGLSADGSIVAGTMQVTGSPFRAFRLQSSVMGETYCRPSVENSTGCGGVVLAKGDPRLATGSLDLTATLLPPNSFGFFATSRDQDHVVNAGGGQGTLCLGGSIGRFTAPGQVMNSGASGSFTLSVDLNAIPTPTGVTAVQPGETWNFQCWHRDMNPMTTSNLTDAVSITFE